MNLRTSSIVLGVAAAVFPASARTQADSNDKAIARADRAMLLTDGQRKNVDPVLERHFESEAAIRADITLTTDERRARLRRDLDALESEIRPYLSPRQIWIAHNLYGPPRFRIHFQLAWSASDYRLTDPVARRIFGRDITFYGLGLESYEPEIGRRNRFWLNADTFGLGAGADKFFAISGSAHYEYRAPIARHLYGYVNAYGGPAYMDYSFNLPSGDHVGAKRLGAQGGVDAGLKWGAFRIAVGYRMFSEPAGVNLNGWTASITLSLLHSGVVIVDPRFD